MELIVVLVVLAALALGMGAYASYSPVNAAVAQNTVSSVPGMTDFFSGWTGLLFKLALGFLLSAIITALVAGVLIPWVRKQWKGQGKGWKSGPNAYWGREEAQPQMSTEKMMMLALLSKLAGGTDSGPVVLSQQIQEPQQEQQNQFPEGWW